MTPRTIVNICSVGLFFLAILYVADRWHTEAWQKNPGYALISIVLLGAIFAVAFVLVVLPRIGDAVGEAMYSSGEQVTQDETMKAAAKMASGDYQGALEEYEKAVRERPDDTFPISEVAKIRSEKLHQPAEAIVYLQEHLEARDWTQDNAAFLMFRMVDIHMHGEDYEAAKDILEQVAGNFPGSRHSANARHRINEIEQLEYKVLQAQRAKAAAAQSGGAA